MAKLFFVWLICLILVPNFSVLVFKAFESYKVDCFGSEFSDGQIVGSYNSQNKTICVFLNETDSDYVKTYRHELCHYYWDKYHLSTNRCNFARLMTEEFSCYFYE